MSGGYTGEDKSGLGDDDGHQRLWASTDVTVIMMKSLKSPECLLNSRYYTVIICVSPFPAQAVFPLGLWERAPKKPAGSLGTDGLTGAITHPAALAAGRCLTPTLNAPR